MILNDGANENDVANYRVNNKKTTRKSFEYKLKITGKNQTLKVD